MGKKKAAMKYDTMFHLFAVLWLADGTVWKIEKNQVVGVKSGNPSGGERMDVSVKTGMTVQQMLDSAVKSKGKELFVYDARDQNCQHFCQALVQAVGGTTPELTKVNNKDAKAVIDNKFQPSAKKLTDVAGILDILQNGQGEKKRIKNLIFV